MPRLSINGKKWLIRKATQDQIQAVYLRGHGKSSGPLCGICDYEHSQILIDDQLSSTEAISTLRHEIIHLFCPDLPERAVLRMEQLIGRAGDLV